MSETTVLEHKVIVTKPHEPLTIPGVPAEQVRVVAVNQVGPDLHWSVIVPATEPIED
jgi:hypothetical protein